MKMHFPCRSATETLPKFLALIVTNVHIAYATFNHGQDRCAETLTACKLDFEMAI